MYYKIVFPTIDKMSCVLSTQNGLLLTTLLEYYERHKNMSRMVDIINGDADISLRIIDWFVTNYAKKNFTLYQLSNNRRFKVYSDYKLKLKSYSKRRFDPFCRWDRITVPYQNDTDVQTTIGQLNFFKWAFENEIISLCLLLCICSRTCRKMRLELFTQVCRDCLVAPRFAAMSTVFATFDRAVCLVFAVGKLSSSCRNFFYEGYVFLCTRLVLCKPFFV